MRYYSDFYSTQNNTHYQLEIITSGDSSTEKEITLSDSPFTTQMDSSDDNIYEPLKTQKATINIVADGNDDFKTDIFSSTAKGTKVNLYKVQSNGTKTVEFIGYADPVVYESDYVSDTDSMQVNVLDGVSILEKLKYDCGGFDSNMNCTRRIVNFQYILYKLVNAAGYSKFYFPQCLKLSSTSTTDLLQYLVISEKNFFDDTNDTDKPTDYDTADTMADVMEKICRWLNVIVMTYKDAFYFIDIDALSAGDGNYYLYQGGSGTPSKVTLTDSRNLTNTLYMSNNSTIQLDKTYRKIEIKDKFNKFDDILPDFFDYQYLTNITKDNFQKLDSDTLRTVVISNSVPWIKSSASNVQSTIAGYDGNMECVIDSSTSARHKDSYYFVVEKWYTSKLVNCYMYEWDDTYYNNNHKAKLLGTSNGTGYPSSFSINDAQYRNKNYYGAILKKEYVKDLPEAEKDLLYASNNWTNKQEAINYVTRNISKLDFNDSIQLFVKGGKKRFTRNNVSEYDKYYKNFPMFTTSFQNQIEPNIFGGDNCFLLISGNVILSHNDSAGYNKDGYEFSKHYRSSIWRKTEYIYCRLKMGNYYFKGYDTNQTLSNINEIKSSLWTTTPTDFKLYFDTYDKEGVKMKDTMYKALKFRNTVRWWFGITDEGYAVPVPSNNSMNDNIEFTMYTPMQQYDDADQDDGRSYYIWIEDLKVKAVIGNPTYSDQTTDTIFTNIIDANFVDDTQSVEMEVTTNDNKQPNYSSVAYSGSTSYFIDTLYNSALRSYESDKTDTNDKNMYGTGKQEEHLLYRLYKQYSTPSVRLKLDLNNDDWKPYSVIKESILNKTFYIDSIGRDYANDSSEMEIREIK